MFWEVEDILQELFGDGGEEMREIRFRAWHKINKEMYYDVWFDFVEVYQEIDGETYVIGKLEEMELMQYTGLSDKNSTEIWEGDILSDAPFNSNTVVRWDSEKGFWDTTDGGLYYLLRRVSLEIIGNIYDNSELLKGKG